MAQLGGFFAVSYVAESVVRQAFDDAWKAGWKQARGVMSYSVPTPVGQLTGQGTICVYKPTATFVGTANAVRVQVPAVVRLDLLLDGAVAGGVYIEVSPTVDVRIVVQQHGVMDEGKADLTGFTIDPGQMNLLWYDGPTDAHGTTAVLSEASRVALTDELRRRAEPFLTFVLPTDRIWAAELAAMTAGGPGAVIVVPFTKLGGVRVLDGWIAMGVDDTVQTPTHGNPLQIGPPPRPPELAERDAQVALIIDTDLLQQYLNLNAKLALLIGLAAYPSIHPDGDPTVTLHDDIIEIASHGQKNAPDPFSGTMPYTASIKVRPYFSVGSGSWLYASVSPDIRVDAPWYLDVLGSIADFFGMDVFAKLRRANKGSMAVLFKASASIDVPGLPGLSASIGGRKIVLRPGLTGFYGSAGTFTRAQPPPSELAVIYRPLGSVRFRERFIQFGFLESWAPLLLSDPTYRLRYEVRRGSTREKVFSGVGWSGSATFGDQFDMWDPSVYLETSYETEVIVERPPGHELARRSESLLVLDLFDRSHPYARWHRKTMWFSGAPPEAQEKVRRSAVHKTAITERCKFSDAGIFSNARTPWHDLYTVQALDEIPPPDEAAFSSRLCPYCFVAG